MNSRTTSQMTDEQMIEFEDILNGMSREHLNLYESMSLYHDDNQYTMKRTGWYTPARRRVEMDINERDWEKAVGRNTATAAWKTKFHEELHQLDNLLGRSKGHGWASAITNCEDGMFNKATPIGKRLKEAITKDILNVVNRAIDEHNKSESEIASTYGIKVKLLKHITDLDKPISKDVKNVFFDYLAANTEGSDRQESRRNRAMISPFTDAVGLMTRSRIDPYSKGFWGHQPSYQKDKGRKGSSARDVYRSLYVTFRGIKIPQ